MSEGVSSEEACRIVGVNERTGRRWRHGQKYVTRSGTEIRSLAGTVRLSGPVATGSGRYLSEADRIAIADRLREGASIRAIARELGRAPSTVSRERHRNAHPASGAYRPHAAHARSLGRLRRSKDRRLAAEGELRSFVQQHLDLRWADCWPQDDLRRCYRCSGSPPLCNQRTSMQR
ncbi:helix-turn-helix domain-containing protein [Glycomyces paridis]